MNDRRLVLHCGPTKTGSSALQAYLRNASLPGMLYPKTGQWADGAHHLLVKSLEGQTRRGSVEIPPFADLLAELTAELSGWSGDVLLSSEVISPKVATDLVHALNTTIPGGFKTVEVVVVLRHPLHRAASTYNQDVKDGVVSESRLPDEYLVQRAPAFRLCPLVRRWEKLPVRTHYLSYHPAETLLPRFLNLIGLCGPEIKPERRNISMNGYGLVTLLIANRLMFSEQERTRLFDALRSDRQHRLWRGTGFPFSDASVQAFLEAVAPDLEELAQTTDIDLREISQDPPRRFQLTPEEVDASLDRLAAAAPEKADRAAVQGIFESFL